MANNDIIYNWGLTNRTLPAAAADGTYAPIRVSRHGELITHLGSWRHALADEGSYFIAHNITIDASTTLAGHPAPVLTDNWTKPFVVMRNTAAVTSTARIVLDYLEIEVITAGASGTSDNWRCELDTGVDRYSSGTVETFTNVNPNMQSSATSALTVRGGPFVATAPTASQRVLGFGVFRPTIAVTGDKYTIRFGDQQETGANVVATATTHHVVGLAPVILGPNDMFLFHLYAPSQSGAGVYKVRCAWWER